MKSLLCLVLGLLAAPGRGETPDESVVSRFLKYRELTRLTEVQIDMVESTRMSCADPRSIYGLHRQPGIHLYASQGAIQERKKNPTSLHFPLGTVLVKEKFETQGADNPSIITVMEKVADKGTVDDWQFHMIRLADRKVVRDGFKVSCIDCHSRFTKSDFVSRETQALLDRFLEK